MLPDGDAAALAEAVPDSDIEPDTDGTIQLADPESERLPEGVTGAAAEADPERLSAPLGATGAAADPVPVMSSAPLDAATADAAAVPVMSSAPAPPAGVPAPNGRNSHMMSRSLLTFGAVVSVAVTGTASVSCCQPNTPQAPAPPDWTDTEVVNGPCTTGMLRLVAATTNPATAISSWLIGVPLVTPLLELPVWLVIDVTESSGPICPAVTAVRFTCALLAAVVRISVSERPRGAVGPPVEPPVAPGQRNAIIAGALALDDASRIQRLP
jgi:hypothetical protein